MTPIKLNIASAKEFQKRVQFIKTDTLRPILSNLKLEHQPNGWKLIKNNLEAVCVGSVQVEGEPTTLLLNERIFFALLQEAKGESILLTLNGNKLMVNDGWGDTELPIEDPANFPVNPAFDASEEPFQLTSVHLRAVGLAKHFISDSETSGNFQFVHVTPVMGIYGFHNNYFYINTAFGGLPEMSLRVEECDVICATEGVGFINLDRHHVFFNGGYTYIFTKSEASPINIFGITDRLRTPGKDFSFAKETLIGFCNAANVVSETQLVDCLIVPMGEGVFQLKMKDANYSRGTERLVSCQGAPDAFAFNSRLLAPPLRSVPYELLQAKILQNNLVISGSGGAGAGLGSEANEWFVFLGMTK